mmetsp:Transcript_25105/g.51142  ORF Transcript_25105/g.51142 Transcript_25105/m.51142 type:complete len:260 (+) Transcript_25105:1158-1937(+)
MILLRNLHTYLHVLRTTRHHILEQRQTLFPVQLAKVSDNKLRIHLMRILEYSLDVSNVSIVLCSTLPHASTFTQLSHMGPIIMSKDTILHDSVCNLGGTTNQVDLKKFSLKVGMLWFVVLQCLKQECCCLLNPVGGQECLCGGLDVNQGPTLRVNETLCQIQRTLGVIEEELTQHGRVIHLETHTCGVGHNFVILTALHKAIDCFRVAVGAEIDTKRHTSIRRYNEITKLLRACELIIFQPLFHKLWSTLLQHRLRKFN